MIRMDDTDGWEGLMRRMDEKVYVKNGWGGLIRRFNDKVGG